MVGRIQSVLATYQKSQPNKHFLIYQALLAALLIIPMGLWRLSIGEYPQGLFDLLISALFVTLAYVARKDCYFRIVSRVFAVTYTVAVWIAIQYTGVIGLHWSYVTTVAVFFSARRPEAIAVALLTYMACMQAVWGEGEPQQLFTYSACYLLVTFFCYNFSSRLMFDNSRLSKEASLDPLTGLGNRRALDDQLNSVTCADDQNVVDHSLIMLDVDHFKEINDVYGHATGDIVLLRLGELLRTLVDPEAELYRYGGEEFLLLVKADLTDAQRLAEYIRECVAKSSLAREHSAAITISLGVAQGKTGIDSRSWLKQADDALYKAKATGRNRVCVAD